MRAENDTLVYGSNDYGQHVWAMNERFNKIMAVAGRKLKLKGACLLRLLAWLIICNPLTTYSP